VATHYFVPPFSKAKFCGVPSGAFVKDGCAVGKETGLRNTAINMATNVTRFIQTVCYNEATGTTCLAIRFTVLLLTCVVCRRYCTSTGCSKSHVTHGLLGICVSWTPHFKETVASTIAGREPPQNSFYGGISRILCIQIIHTHTHCKSFRPTFSALWTGYQLAHCKTCSLT
jgi:hypothetical protein